MRETRGDADHASQIEWDVGDDSAAPRNYRAIVLQCHSMTGAARDGGDVIQSSRNIRVVAAAPSDKRAFRAQSKSETVSGGDGHDVTRGRQRITSSRRIQFRI